MGYASNNKKLSLKRPLQFAVAFLLLLLIACSGPTQNDPTAIVTAAVSTSTPTEPPTAVVVVLPTTTPTQTPPTSEPARSPSVTATPATTTPDTTATPTFSPAIADTPVVPSSTPLPYHFETSAEAEKAAIELGCSGWKNVVIGEINYFRACAGEIPAEDPTAKPTVETKQESTVVTNPSQTATPIGTEIVVPEPTAPAYHFTTSAEAEAATRELGCTGTKNVEIDGVFYIRACADDSAFGVYALGVKTTLSGRPCTIESDPTARFTAAPTDLSLVRAIVSTGSAAGGVIKPHSYLFNHATPGTMERDKLRVPVYAVADSFVNAIAYYGTSVGTSEYLIFFDVTCEISFKYDHIAEVVPKLLAVAPATPSEGSQTTRTELIHFEAGELIGYTPGAGGVGPWDFGAYDLTFTNQFANQERYVRGDMKQSLHTVCPYEYFTEPLRSQMLAKIGTYSTFIEGNPTCFTTERDVLGAASGAWFDSPELTYRGAKLSIALTEAYEVGITGAGSDMRVPTTDPTYLDPDLLTTSHCYLANSRWFYIEIQDEGMQLAAASGTGSCPSVMPTEATIYYR